MLRNIENLNSVALILSDLNIGVVVGTGSAIAHDLHLRERLLDMPMEEFPGQPLLGKRPDDTQPDTTDEMYPAGGLADFAGRFRPADAASARPSRRAEGAPCCCQTTQSRRSKAPQKRHKSWRSSRAKAVSSGLWDVVAPVSCQAVVSS